MIRLAVRVSAADAEVVLAELLELAPGGVEEVELDGGARVEYAVYGSPGELPELPDVRAAAGGARVEVSSSEVPDGWEERWKRFHRPVLIRSPAPGLVRSLCVRPSWEIRGMRTGKARETDAAGRLSGTRDEQAPGSPGGEIEIVIDPGRAFGTGSHASTRLCLELLLGLAASETDRGALLDVGTGTGVLAIAAAKLGYAPVAGVDNDRESVSAATENARVNGVSIELGQLDLRTQALWPAGEAGHTPRVLVANLLRPLLIDLARALPAPPAHLLAGGLLAEEADEIVGVYADRLGLRERERARREGWAAVWLQACPR